MQIHSRGKNPFVLWPAAILQSPALIAAAAEMGGSVARPAEPAPEKSAENFRDKFPAEHRATDGHYVRSKAELLIDNWLYMSQIAHAYERKLPVEESVYCDFYLPCGRVYIEYWGYENDPKYQARMAQKRAIYEKYNLSLIELTDKEVQNLDDVLPGLLMRFGVRVE